MAMAAPLMAQGTPTFRQLTKELQTDEDWTMLLAVGKTEYQEGLQKKLACAYVAVAYAGREEWQKSVEWLQKVREEGGDPDVEIFNIGIPLEEVLATVRMHSKRKNDPAYDRACWEPYLTAFPESPQTPWIASNLLSAAHCAAPNRKTQPVTRHIS